MDCNHLLQKYIDIDKYNQLLYHQELILLVVKSTADDTVDATI